MLRLISHPIPGVSSAGRVCPGLSVPHTLVSRSPAAPGWKAFSPAWSCSPRSEPSPVPPTAAVVDDPVDYPTVVLQGHPYRSWLTREV